jgi:hypothetical protein
VIGDDEKAPGLRNREPLTNPHGYWRCGPDPKAIPTPGCGMTGILVVALVASSAPSVALLSNAFWQRGTHLRETPTLQQRRYTARSSPATASRPAGRLTRQRVADPPTTESVA